MYRERLTITLSPELLKAIDESTDGKRLRNRSHAIEYLLSKGLALDKFNTAFLFLDADITQYNLEEALSLCKNNHLTNIFISQKTLLNKSAFAENEIKAISKELHIEEPTFISDTFGDGGVLAATKNEIANQTFALIFVNREFNERTNLLPAFVFHQNNNAVTTLILNKEKNQFIWNNILIAESSIINYLEIGNSDIRQQVLPKLEAKNQVKLYLNDKDQ